jgi:asparagine synthase (glutamine-hydrolysing)
MCGIIGVVSVSPVANSGLLTAGSDAMRHRGPDGAGEWWSQDRCVGLGHRRLSIIDLGPGGHQPMLNINGKLCIVFNGEIYNYLDLKKELQAKGYTFSSSSDTEVILAAYLEWGTGCITHFNGMFAFSLYDSSKRKVFMARDRAGEKPFYYKLSNGVLHFASELKGLMTDPSLERTIDREAMDCYLSMGYVPGELCILKGVKKLPPAHALEFNLENGELKKWQYWHLPEVENYGTGKVNEVELLDELEALLQDAVGRQLTSDVPVGVLLSGGVDSSLVTGMAVRAASNVKTFTIRFPGFVKYDETAHARLIANHFGTKHVELDAAESTVDMLPLLARQFDEPIVDSSMIPTYLVSKLIRQHCTVALGGDGGDELFGGYGHYNRLLWLQKKLSPIPRGFRLPIANLAEKLLPVGFKGRNWLQGMGVDLENGLPLIANYFDHTARKKLLKNIDYWAIAGESIREKRIPYSTDLLQRATRMDFENYLPEDILVKVDRASMLNSLEVRAPFLDYRVIEFAYSKVPTYLKTSTSDKKILLKRLCSRMLPAEFDQQRKQGFSIPLAHWLQSGPWLEYFQEILLDSGSMFSKDFVEALIDGQKKGRSNSERLFSLVLFELWRKQYNVSI